MNPVLAVNAETGFLMYLASIFLYRSQFFNRFATKIAI